MITNPEYLPKERLKQELKKHGIKFNSNENKDYYVQLYRDELMQGKEPERITSEFSSDEEFVKQNSRASKKQTKTKGKQAAAPKMDTYLPQVSTLSDEELAAQLQGYGEIIGPITATTRIVYERQLAKLMATEGENAQPVPAANSHEEVDYEAQNESFIGEWSDDEEEEEEAESAPPPPKQVYSRSSRTKKQYSETIHISSRGDLSLRQRSSKPTSSTLYKPVKPARPTSSAKQPPSPSSGTSWSNILSLICSILLIVLMFSIAFLVYEHYMCPEEQESLIVSGWKKGGLLIEQAKAMILKEVPAEDDGAKVTKAESNKSSGKPTKSKLKKPPTSDKKA